MEESEQVTEKRGGLRYSRRRLIGLGISVPISMASIGLLSACQSPSSASPTPAAPATAGAPATTGTSVRRGGTLTRWARTDAPNFDPHQNVGFDCHNVVGLAYSSLLQYNPARQDEIIPDLAESWSANSDGTEHTFKLRADVRWHDGERFTSKDAVYSIKRMVSPPSGVTSVWKGLLASIDSVSAPDDRTVTVRLKYADASFLSVIALGSCAILPAHVAAAEGEAIFKTKIVGTGPFMLKQVVAGSRYTFERNPDYFVKGQPLLDRVDMLVIKDPGTMVSAFIAGQLMAVPRSLSVKDASRIKAQVPSTQVFKLPQLTYGMFGMSTTAGPWKDLRVRQAVNLALDRQAASKVMTEGEGPIGFLFPPQSQWALPEAEVSAMPGYGGDIAERRAEARKLLAAAGFPTGFSVEWPLRSDADHLRWGEFMVDQLRQIGIIGTLKPMEQGQAFAALRAGTYQAYSWREAHRIDDPSAAISERYLPSSASNWLKYNNQKVTDLFDRQARELDPGRRKGVVAELQRALAADLGVVVAYWEMDYGVGAAQVRGWNPHRSPLTDNKAAGVWLDV